MRTNKRLIYSVALAAGIALTLTMLSYSPRVHADDGDSEESKIQQGFDIAPVPLNLKGKNRALVGLGSYLVNGAADCNGCHNPGPGGNEFLAGGNPFFGQQKMIDPLKYLVGGRDFGPFMPGSAHIVSRNLTPDKTGMPEGGRSFDDFVQIMRTGADLDNLHPTCTGALNPGCVPHPFDGTRLQIMPWPSFQNLTDRDLRAIYEYLSAIPCLAGPPAPDPRHNDCP